MRISDWSSDVCSSDLLAGQVELGECPDVLDVRQRALVHEAGRAHRFWRRFARRGQRHDHVQVSGRQRLRGLRGALELPRTDGNSRRAVAAAGDIQSLAQATGRARVVERDIEQFGRGLARSEEHTSELQSLMRISYAVFCLKTNTHTS